MNFHIFQEAHAEFTVILIKSPNTSLNFCKDVTVKYSNYAVWLYWESVSLNVFISVFDIKLWNVSVDLIFRLEKSQKEELIRLMIAGLQRDVSKIGLLRFHQLLQSVDSVVLL